MRTGIVFIFLGWLILFLSAALLLPMATALYYNEDSWIAFAESALIGSIIGVALTTLIKGEKEMGHKEGFVVVAFAWLAAAALGALPYWLSGGIPSYLDAYFEAMSGFTTTGSTILSEIEHLGKGLLLWRSITQWLGGMGIIVLSLAILPILGIGGMQLYKAEMPGPTKDKLAPRIQDTARILWGVYILLTAMETGLLMFAGLDFYEAINHAFTTLSTGGFSTQNGSIADFNNPLVDYIISFFMFVAGINFTLHYWLLRGHPVRIFKNEEFRFYALVTLCAVMLIMTANYFYNTYTNFADNLRYTLFQVCSIFTTAGFGTADFDQWAPVCKLALVSLMFLGGMAGSTAGGIKNIRIIVFGKFTRMQINKLIHPRSVEAIKVDGQKVPQEVIQSILGFLALYVTVFILATLIVTAHNIDLITGATAVIATLNNIGPGLAKVGPACHFGHLPGLTKIVLIICMVAGRLELYTIAVLAVPAFWKDLKPPVPSWHARKTER